MRGEGIHDDLTYLAEARCGRWLGDRWLLARVLGVGGTSAVYEATHRNGRRAALKVLHPQWAMMPTARRRFLREGYISNRVEHPAVVAVLDDGETSDGEAYLVLELLEGESLSAVLAQAGRLPTARAVEIARRVLEVLAAAHEKGIIHRDIKPDNLMVLPDGSLKVLDFGIASVKTADASATLATQPGGARGTPAYMAPEQARGQPVDARTDLWAVGAVLFRMLSGQPVRQASSPEAMLVQAATQPAPALQHAWPAAPPGLAALVDRALSFEPRGRFDTAREMLAALRATGSPAAAPSAENATLPEGAAAHDDAPRPPDGSRQALDDPRPPLDGVPGDPRPLDAHRTIEAAPLDAASLARSGDVALMAGPDAPAVPVADPGAPAEPDGLAVVAPPPGPSPSSRRWALAALAAGLALAALLARPLLAGPAAPAASSAAAPSADPLPSPPAASLAAGPPAPPSAASAPAPPALSAPTAAATTAAARPAPRPLAARPGAPAAPSAPAPAPTEPPAQASATPPDPFPFRKRH